MRRFPSLFQTMRLRPESAWLNPTDNCNMRCIMCGQWRETKTGELTLDEWKALILQLRDRGIRKIGLNGGETLLRKDIVDLIDYITAQGMDAAIITSGYLLDDAKLTALIDAGLKHVTVSIDGVGAEYEKIRRREWPRVEKAVRLVAQAYREGRLDANIGFVVMRQTLAHLDGVRALCQEVGLPLMFSLVDCTPFFFKLPENHRRVDDTNWVTAADRPLLRSLQRRLVEMKGQDHYSMVNTYGDIDYMSSYFDDPLQRKIPCTVSQLRIMINGRGEVYGGCWSMGSYGNVRQTPLPEILESKKFRKAHHAMFYKLCPGCSCGYTTNVRYSLPLQLKDRLFNFFPFLRRRIYAKEHALP